MLKWLCLLSLCGRRSESLPLLTNSEHIIFEMFILSHWWFGGAAPCLSEWGWDVRVVGAAGRWTWMMTHLCAQSGNFFITGKCSSVNKLNRFFFCFVFLSYLSLCHLHHGLSSLLSCACLQAQLVHFSSQFEHRMAVFLLTSLFYNILNYLLYCNAAIVLLVSAFHV